MAETISNKNFTSEALLRRSINACLRVGTEKTLDLLIGFSERNDITDKLRSEALEIIGSWANPSVLDRVDGRYRGEIKNDSALVKAKMASEAKGTETDSFKETLFGGIRKEGSDTFNYNSAVQCVRCHSVGQDGGNVGPNLKRIGSLLSREQILQAMIEPSARLALCFGTVTLTPSDGQTVTSVLEKEDETELVLETTNAEPLKIAKIRIKSRENQPSSMPPMGSLISKREIRNLVEYLSSLK